MDEYEFVAMINMIAEDNNCRVYAIDFKTREIRIEGPENNQSDCAQDIDDFVNNCGEVTGVVDNGIAQLTNDIGWIL